MSFWNNPENNSVKVILIVIVVAILGYFVFNNINSGNKGQVLNTTSMQSATTTVAPAAEDGALTSGVAFTLNTTGTTCTYDMYSIANPKEEVAVAGTMKNGKCSPNAKQFTANSQSMADAMGPNFQVQ